MGTGTAEGHDASTSVGSAPLLVSAGVVQTRHGRPVLRLLLIALVLMTATSGQHRLTELERIQARGKLVMLTINGATTYYLGPNGESGFEYDLASRFADYLGVPLEVLALPTVDALMPTLARGRGDFLAANLSRTADRAHRVRFGPVYETVSPVVVYRRGTRRPRSVEDLADGRLGGEERRVDGVGRHHEHQFDEEDHSHRRADGEVLQHPLAQAGEVDVEREHDQVGDDGGDEAGECLDRDVLADEPRDVVEHVVDEPLALILPGDESQLGDQPPTLTQHEDRVEEDRGEAA